MFRETREQGKISTKEGGRERKCLPVYPSFLSLDYKKRNLKPMVLLYGTDWVLHTKIDYSKRILQCRHFIISSTSKEGRRNGLLRVQLVSQSVIILLAVIINYELTAILY